jgi:hypothetical protein
VAFIRPRKGYRVFTFMLIALRPPDYRLFSVSSTSLSQHESIDIRNRVTSGVLAKTSIS